MSKNRGYSPHRQLPAWQYPPPNMPSPYVGQWITASIPNMGPIVAHVADFNPINGMVGLWVYRPGGRRREFIQYHYSDLTGVNPYYGPLPPYQQGPTLPQPLPPQPTPPYQQGPIIPPQPHSPVRRSCRHYRSRSQQLACYMGLIPPI
ncbi:hypothetical protein [Ammoniphilus oxalaticus]|uniref:hypothetical protein n=1 Tax=Ammoniphilus oxalaticus TaxID=66863 RepID=UPI0011C3D48D|nr:hypothetical protein [Ammoniphilus oxalaticus]